MQAPPGQFHESPTEQYWNGLQNEPITMTSGANHSNTNLFAQHYNVNNNNLSTTNDYDGTIINIDRGWF